MREIERFRIADPEALTMLQKYYQEDDLPDNDYLDYETPKHIEHLRHRYYPDSILVGKAWGGGEGEMVLLNPHIVSLMVNGRRYSLLTGSRAISATAHFVT